MYNFKSNGYILKKNVLSENRCLDLINEINKLETYLLKNKPEQNGRLQLENDHKLNIDLEFDFEQLRKESKIIKQKLNQNSKNDHGGAPFAGLLDTTKPIINNDIEFEDYKDLENEGHTYKLNIHDNQVIDISNVATEYDADKVRLVGIWNEQRETIT